MYIYNKSHKLFMEGLSEESNIKENNEFTSVFFNHSDHAYGLRFDFRGCAES